MLVYTCTDGDEGTTTTFGGNSMPTCSSGGAWAEIAVTSPDFSVDQLDPALLAQAFGAGLVTVGTGLIIAFAMRVIIRAVKTA